MNDGGEPSNLNGISTTTCGGAGTWNESPASGSSVWSLTQTGNTISGTLTVGYGTGCAAINWKVAGTSTSGVLNLTASSPSPAEVSCGGQTYVAATTVTANKVAVSGAGCDSASGTDTDTYTNPSQVNTFPVTWSSTAAIPSSETSTFDQWGPDGYSNQGLFSGHLTITTGSAEFAGRKVQESFPSDFTDGCALLDPNGELGALHAPKGVVSSWTVLGDSSYTDDWIGYGPAITRYYQTYVGTCTLKAPQQQMSISSDNGSLPYKANALEYDVTATTVTAKRDTAAQTRTYPK